MIKAVINKGVICPQQPLPEDWGDGTELQVERTSLPQESGEELDRWMARVQASAGDMDPEDEVILDRTIREVRQQARELARKQTENP